MEKQVWNAASKDSVGLQNVLSKEQISNYMWKDRVDATVLTSANENIEKGSESTSQGMVEDIEAIETELNKNDVQNIISTNDVFESGDQALPENFEFKKGISKIYFHNDAYHVIMVNKVMPKTNKTLDEARG